MKNSRRIFLALMALGFLATARLSFADVKISPANTAIEASIKYTVIGRYRAGFDEFTGEVIVDEETGQIRSVILKIVAASIKSNCSWCDKIVRSKQLLWVEEFPEVVFRSEEITQDDDGYKARGALSLHGVTKEFVFPFYVEGLDGNSSGVATLKAKGQWLINRKEFNITWNKVLDQGGVLVGNYITVDWEINATPDN